MALNRSHSELVKFSKNDTDYETVRTVLKRMITTAVLAVPRGKNRSNPDEVLTKDQMQSCIDSLSFERIDARLRNIKKAHHMTCAWLSKQQEYKHWLDPRLIPKHHGILWIKGKPGAGKSTMMKHTYLSAKKDGTTEVISFFFNARGSVLEKSVLGLYRSLFFQLLTAIPTLQKDFAPVFSRKRKHGDMYQWSSYELQDLLTAAVKKLGNCQLSCFIDALDECQDNEVRDAVEFLGELGDTAVSYGISLSICLSSRHYPHISIRNGIELTLEGKTGHDQDIASYVGSKFIVPSGGQKEIIKDTILSRASGIFLWVVLVVRILNDAYDAGRMHALQGLLEEIPNELDELFASILARDFKTRNESILCLQWLLFAQRPLRRAELYFAILSGTEPAILREWGHAEVTDETIDKYILNCSKGLAEVSKAKDETIQFIHESVRDFLLRGNGLASLLQSDPACDITGLSHERLKECCYQYITADMFPFQIFLCVELPHPKTQEAFDLRIEISTQFPFIEYATENIFNHANIAQGYNVLQGDFLQSFESASPTGQTSRRRWIAFHNILQRYQIRRYTPTAKFLYIFAEKGFQNLVQVLLDGKSNVDATGERYGNALQAASTNGYTALVQLLIGAGANVNIPGGEYGYPIAAAMSRNHKPIVELLLDKAADPTADRNLATKLLIQSVKNGDEAIFRHLFANPKVDLNTRDASGRTALVWAILKGHDTIASQLLVNPEVDPNIQDYMGRTALVWAILNGYDTIALQLLTDPKVDLNTRDSSGGTALSHAIVEGRDNIVLQLLANPKVDPNIEDNHGWTALSWAKVKSNETLVQQLGANLRVNLSL